MRILLLNPPHTAIGSRIPKEHLPPLGLLSVAGPLLDAGFAVELLDAEFGPMAVTAIVDEVVRRAPDLLLTGHSGSTSAHPTVAMIAGLPKARLPELRIVYGGVFPTYHWHDVLAKDAAIDIIVRGEGERTALRLAQALGNGDDLASVPASPTAAMARCWRRARPRCSRTSTRRGWHGNGSTTTAIPTGADARRWWCSSRAVVPTCAATAGNVVSGPVGAIATRPCSRRNWRACIASTACR